MLLTLSWSASPSLVCSMLSLVCTICQSVCCNQHSRLSLLLVLCIPTANTCAYCHAPFHLLHQACPTMRPHLNNADRGSEKGQPLGLRTKVLLYRPTYMLLPHTRATMFYIHLVLSLCTLLYTNLACSGKPKQPPHQCIGRKLHPLNSYSLHARYPITLKPTLMSVHTLVEQSLLQQSQKQESNCTFESGWPLIRILSLTSNKCGDLVGMWLQVGVHV